MLGEDERDATEEEIAALEASTGRFSLQTARDRPYPSPGSHACVLRQAPV